MKKNKSVWLTLLLLAVMTSVYMSRLDGTFQTDSETHATGVLLAAQNGVQTGGFGLGRYYDLTINGHNGERYYLSEAELLNNADFANGYAQTRPAVAVPNNPYTEKVFVPGNTVRFAGGQTRTITDTLTAGGYRIVSLAGDALLGEGACGPLAACRVLDAAGTALSGYVFEPYESQLGLHGFVYYAAQRAYDRLAGENAGLLTGPLRAGAAFFMALTALLLVLQLRKRYNLLAAGIAWAVFTLSPWIVNFANKLYWVEFTWFLPALAGAYAVNHMDKRARCALLMFLAVLVRSLCGYEYVSTVMLSGVVFLLVEWLAGEKGKRRAAFFSLLAIGLAALLGFFAALALHGLAMGGGNLAEGLSRIVREVALKRTWGGSADFEARLAASLDASPLTVVLYYFHFSTPVLTGLIGGKLFPLLCAAPLVTFAVQAKGGRVNAREVAFYALTLLSTLSWYLLAKGHSYDHTHLNFVLWYFGFVQSCVYIPARALLHRFAASGRPALVSGLLDAPAR